MAGGYEREAIRPHVLGRFVDMLLAAEGHPAMLIYLNDAQSIGPLDSGGLEPVLEPWRPRFSAVATLPLHLAPSSNS